MCHSLEMYMPKITRDAAEGALEADRRAAARERALIDLALGAARAFGRRLAALGRRLARPLRPLGRAR